MSSRDEKGQYTRRDSKEEDAPVDSAGEIKQESRAAPTIDQNMEDRVYRLEAEVVSQSSKLDLILSLLKKEESDSDVSADKTFWSAKQERQQTSVSESIDPKQDTNQRVEKPS